MIRALVGVDRRKGHAQRTTRMGRRAADEKDHNRQRRDDNSDPGHESRNPFLIPHFHLETVVACAWPALRRLQQIHGKIRAGSSLARGIFRAMQSSRAGRSVTAEFIFFGAHGHGDEISLKRRTRPS